MSRPEDSTAVHVARGESYIFLQNITTNFMMVISFSILARLITPVEMGGMAVLLMVIGASCVVVCIGMPSSVTKFNAPRMTKHTGPLSGTDIKITFGVCVKNSERTVRATIESITRQKYPHNLIELIVVDGCSRDKTLPIVKSIVTQSDIESKFYSDEGMGLGYARQIVATNASGRYVIFVDGDVEILDDFVQRQVDFMENNAKVGVALAKYMYRGAKWPPTLLSLQYQTHHQGFIGSAFVCRREALAQVGGFDQNIRGAAEDLDLMVRIQKQGWALSTNDKIGFYDNSERDVRDLFLQQVWFGYGEHYFEHKHKLRSIWKKVPFIVFAGEFRLVVGTYKKTRRKLCFLTPLLFAFLKIPWWFGFVKGHLDGYGHETC
ncbi:glycosyltransferase [Candidatus Bathyarchaeota archaeon]|nr:glycosyltransferase [Candidatus Bathyarchaeota archaeon]